jgi:DNA polymerase III subunit gamma/tau
MREQAASFGPAQLARAAETINAGLVEMRGATSPRLQLELICAQVLLPAPNAGDGALLARIERLERRLGSGAAEAPAGAAPRPAPASGAPRPASSAPSAKPEPPAAKPEPPAAEAKPESTAHPAVPANGAGGSAARPAGSRTPDADRVRERWPEILDAVRHRSKVAWAQLSNATVDTLQDGILTLRFAQVGTATGFSARGSDEDLGQALEQVLGMSPKIKAVSASAREGSAGAGEGGAALAGSGPGGAGPGGAGPGGAGPGGAGPGGAGPSGAGRGSRAGASAGAAAAGDAGLSPGDAANPGGDASARAGAAEGAAASGRTGGQAPRRNPGPAAPGRAAPGGAEEPGHDPEVSALTGMDLIQRTLGGQVIEEIGDA